MRSRLIAALASIAALGVCITASAAPLEAYSRLPAVSDVVISDDGQTIAYVATSNQQQTVVVRSLTGEVLQQVSFGSSKIRAVQWAGADYVVVTTSTRDAIGGVTFQNELFQAASLNVRTGATAQLLDAVRAGDGYSNIILSLPVTGVWQGEPVAFVEALAGTQNSITRRVDLMRVDLDDGMTRLHQLGSDNAAGFLVLPSGDVVAQATYDQQSTVWRLQIRRTGGGWREAFEVRAPVDTPTLGGLTADGAGILLEVWNEQLQQWRYMTISRETLDVTEASLPPDSSAMYNDDQRLIGYGAAGEDYTFTDPAMAANWQRISATSALRGRQITLMSQTPDASRLIIFVEGAGFPGNYFLFDAAGGRLAQVGRAYPDIPSAEIAEVRDITYRAADGLEIPAILTLPPGRPATNLPIVVLPHGGPQSSDDSRFDWMAQSLASRGYAVLQPQFRGSAGQGQAFIEAAYGEWGRKMQTDLSDGIAHLASQGIVDPQRACIMGASYGGYAALAGVTVQDGVYRCAVAIAPVSDLESFLRWRISRSGRDSDAYRYWARYLGVNDPGDPRLAEISPVRLAGNGNAPVLLIHGRDDVVVPFAQSSAVERALRERGRPVELVSLREEDHWLSREASRVQTMAAAVAFLEQHNPPN